MPKLLVSLAILLYSFDCLAQNRIQNIIDTIEKYHVGYKYFHAKSLKYKKFKNQFLKRCAREKNIPESLAISDFLNFFKDNHFFYYTTDSSLKTFHNFNSKNNNSDLVGLWQDIYSETMYQIFPKNNGDLCFVQIRGRDSLKIIRYSYTGFASVLDFRSKLYVTGYEIEKGVIYKFGKPFLKKIHNKNIAYKRQIKVFDGFSQTKLSDSIYLLRIGALNSNYSKKYDSVINSIHNEIIKTKYLIIDLRDCPGGSVSVLEPLFKYIYDGNIISYVQGYTAPTIETINARLNTFNNSPKLKTRLDSLNFFESIENDKKNINKVYKDVRVPIKFDKKIENIKKVFILQNRRTQSSGELFILAVANSEKVFTIGENTNGTVDYGDGNLVEWEGFGISISSSMCDYIDEVSYETVGIKPKIVFNNINNFNQTLNLIIKDLIK